MRKKRLISVLLLVFNVSVFVAQTDLFDYGTADSGEKLVNLFLRSSMLNEGAVITPPNSGGEDARGMVVYDGSMFFVNLNRPSQKYSVVELDQYTGISLQKVVFPKEMFEDEFGVTISEMVNTDISVDSVGNLFVCNLTNSLANGAQGTFRINYVNMNDTTYETILNLKFPDETLFPQIISTEFFINSFDVWGDLRSSNGSGVILIAVSGMNGTKGAGNKILKYNVNGGVVDVNNPDTVKLSGFYGISNSLVGAFPQINIINRNEFYYDGTYTFPSRYDMSGNILSGAPKTAYDVEPSAGPNGSAEFKINGESYLIMPITSTAGTPPSAYDIYKFSDSNRSLTNMNFLFRFPEAGMGRQANSICYVQLPRVEVVKTAKGEVARISVFVHRNGYGTYEFWNTTPPSGLENLSSQNKIKIAVNNNTINLSENVTSISLYNITGQKVLMEKNTNNVIAPQKGIYIIKVTLIDKSEFSAKIHI